MVIDYRERKPVNKNKPKSKPVGLMLSAVVVVAICSFGAGVLVDRFIFHANRPQDVQMAGQPAGAKPVDPAAQKAASPQTTGGPAEQKNSPLTGEPPLTFYETLPKGGKAILGTGINASKSEVPRSGAPGKAASPAPAPVPSAADKGGAGDVRKNESQRPVEGEGARSAEKSDTGRENLQRKSSPGSTFSVQVASSKDRKEAEEIRKSLVGRGYAAYIVETEISGKGTWFRVRVGKTMDQGTASSLATVLGKGAIVIPGEIK